MQGGPFSACWAGGWASTDAITHEQNHWASKLGFVLGLQWGQSNRALYTNQRSDQRTSHCSVSMALVNLWRWYFYFSPVVFGWEWARQIIWVIIACKPCRLYLSDSLFIELRRKVELFEVSYFTGLQFSICVVIWVPQIQKTLFGSFFIGRLLPTLPAIN